MLLDADFEYINEAFEADRVTPQQLDTVLAHGWRHFGTYFFRYNLGFLDFDIRRVIPLRTRLSEFSLSKSQRRVLRRNEHLEVIIRPIEIDDAASAPCETKEVCVYKDEKLIAGSYFDLGARTASGIYAIFEPSEGSRSLGIFTMLKEIEFAIEAGKEFYYQGYSYEGESFYDYKKRFRGTEMFDWNGNWKRLATELTEITET
jgi:arginyl-tRNA--protein-N-Asp/Glu arginylyltransferase